MKSINGSVMRRSKSVSSINPEKKGLILEVDDHHPNDSFRSCPGHEAHGSIGESGAVKLDVERREAVRKRTSPIRSKEVVLAHKNADSGNACTVPLFDEVQLLSESQSCRYLLDPLVKIGVSAFQSLNMDLESHSDSRQLACYNLTGMEDCGNNEEMIKSEKLPSLLDFEEKCPPGGSESVVLYTTSLRGIRKTFEDCNTIRFLLESFRVQYYDRDVSMHLEYREELWAILGGRVVPPRLFIRGRHMGGADEVVGLHERGMLKQFLQGIPLKSSNSPCEFCAGLHFVLCFTCNGSRKIISEGRATELAIRCQDCNENGLVKCPVCS